MEQLVVFNGVRIVLTTGKRLSEVQSFVDNADVIISVYPTEANGLGGVKIIKSQWSTHG